MNMHVTLSINELHLRKHLQALGYTDGDKVYLRSFSPVKGVDGGRKDEFTLPDIPIERLNEWQRERRGIYLVVNGGHKDTDVQSCRAVFYEHDDLRKDISKSLWQSLGLPEPSVQIDTGGKSIHSYWVFDEQCSVEKWRSLQSDLLQYANADRSLKNPSRVMRLAGCTHAGSGQLSRIVGGHATRYSYGKLRSIIPTSTYASAPVEGVVTWGEFDKSFRFPILDSVPLEQCLSRNNRELLSRGANSERNNKGFQMAAALISTAAYLTGEGQRFDGDPYQLFIQYCQNCVQGDGWNQHEWDSIWKSAQTRPREIKMNPDWIINLVKAWAWNNRPQQKAADVSSVGKTIPTITGSVELDEPPDTATDEEKLKFAIANYVKVRDSGNRFQQIPLKGKISRDFSISKSDVEELAKEIERGRAGDLVSSADILIPLHKEIEDRSLKQVETAIASGFYDLDALTQGLYCSDLWIVAARPSMGKTSFIVNIARYISEKMPIAIFSLETSKEQLAYRLLATESRIEYGRLRSGRIQQGEWDSIAESIYSLSEKPLYIDDTPAISVNEIQAKLKRLIATLEQPLGMVAIDYLQLMSGSGDNRVIELSGITRALKCMAREMNVPVVSLSQLSRGVETRNDKRPILSDLRDSGGIEQDADLVLMLYRDEYYNPDTPDRGLAEVIVRKHRNGPIGTIKLIFDSQFTEFKNLKNYGW